ncbi:hypothetical protein EBS67_18460 [bacterium]|nr:hypothetical protein [bacterium]NBT63073.1 hypothetical protein [Planctomycetia bacterium]
MRNIMPAFCLLIVISGCSSGPVVPTSIQGKILFQKQPLRGGTIAFTPDMERGSVGPMAYGVIIADGTYTVLPQPGKDSIHAGWYKVSFLSQGLPPKFSDPSLSGQVKQILSGQINKIDFNLE